MCSGFFFMDSKALFSFIKKNFERDLSNKISNFLYLSLNTEGILKKYQVLKLSLPKNFNNEKEALNLYALALNLANAKKIHEAYLLLKVLIKILPKIQNEIYYNLGKILNLKFEATLAIFYLKKSEAIYNKSALVLFELGLAHQRLGKIELSKEYFRKTFNLEPRFVEAHRLYSVSHKYIDAKDPHLKLMLDVLNKNINYKDNELVQLNFSIGKAYEDLSRYEESFLYYEKANSIMRKNNNYSSKVEKNQQEVLKNISIKIKEKKFDLKVKSKKKIIFIVGMPRSGTTLLEQIIASHSKINSLGEPLHFPNTIKKIFPEKDLSLFEKSFDHISYKTYKNFYDDIAKLYDLDNTKYLAVTDKLPFNFKFIGLINYFLPDAKILHIKRSPQDTCISIYKNYFHGSLLGFSSNQNELAEYYKVYQSYIEHWKSIGCNFFEIDYENLVNNILEQTKTIFEYLNMPFEQNVINFYSNSNIVSSLSTAQVRKKNYTSSINSWKNYKNFLIEDIKSLK